MTHGRDTDGYDATARLFPGTDPTSAAHRATDWSATPLGPVESWPAELRAAVRTVLPSKIPMLIWWGPELVQIFNDPYTGMVGDKFPAAVGQRGAECWAEAWDTLGPMTEQVLAGGGATYAQDQLLFLQRHGYREETYWTFSYSPIHRADGSVAGIFVATSDVTGRLVSDRRLALLRTLGNLSIAEADTAGDAARAAARILAEGRADLPLGLVYLRDEQLLDDERGERPPAGQAGDELTMVASFGTPAEDDSAPDGPAAPGGLAEVAQVMRTGQPARITGLARRRAAATVDGMPVDDAVALPLLATGRARPVGVLVLGVTPYRELDEPYRHFLDLVANRVSTALTDVLAYAAQRRRAAALAELDAAKTEFFTDVSHELRTPLTLITGPVQESLADQLQPLPPAQRERLEVVRRNAGRLRKLVNDMLDFARIEAGRLEAERAATDLAALTAGVAESFAHAMRQGGLDYRVDVRPLPRTAYVDRDMWEKVVVNLLSNALKYTLSGAVRLHLHGDDDEITLTVSDTGVGVPADQQELLFRRFHRVRGSGGRSHEGTGIGLALVQELVRLHGGDVGVRSVEGEGSTFTVRLPYGRPTGAARVAPARPAYPQEALSWPAATRPGEAEAAGPAHPAGAPTVLVVEDNVDLRAFLAGLLAPHYRVVTAVDGRDGLAQARALLPDLVLTDMMMPRLDGFGLLRELRADRHTATVPVIVLSARAGEEAAVEGLRAGADDYLAKPFSSEELLARVRAHLELARLRNQEATWRAALVDSLQDAFAVVEPDGTLVEANDAFCRLIGVERLRLPSPPPYDWWPDGELEPAERDRLAAALDEAARTGRGRLTLPLRHADGHRIWVAAVYNSVREPRTDRRLYVATLRDVTTEVNVAARSAALAALSGRLAGASDITEVLDAGLSHLGNLVGGARGIAVTLDGAGAPVVVSSGVDLSDRVRRILAELDNDGEPVLTRDDAGRVTGLGTRIEPGVPDGGIWLELDPPRPLPALDRPLVRQLSGALAQALVRARAYETQRTVALAMQRAMLGPVELPAGFAVRYEPAFRPLEVGGDWYDVVPLPGNLVGVVVGDCVGRGLPAATVMGQLRNACRALLLQAKSPAEVLSALDDFARFVPGGGNTTVFCAIVDRSLGVLRYSSAGHPPAVLMHADGSAELLDRAGSVPLASVAVSGRPEAGARLPADSTLLLYTDGLVERRRELIDAGIARAVDILAEGRQRPEAEVADRLIRDLVPDVRNDDVAVLVYRHREPAVFYATLAADPAQLSPTREALRGWLAGLGVGASDVEAVLIAVGEACANAIEHGYRFAPGATVTVRGRLRAGRLEVEVTDSGGWREVGADGGERGRGRLIMARLMDEAVIDGTPQGTVVRLAKRLSGAA
ncbi:SpoIIE family protein phosphatase [Micromonospora purpureochromogenes]|uniref:histidine kinase n=1 Tax=Micromonospora purpureochromogenes TaxID=47872 RepID=A0ABX2RU81_9ACTN|nr:SpoIIE family protein phosphatase [Micromonospora purpureochromogenes]NYF59761.1 PAS domain S-box-containing protein [Micromonospora purpureochromogenes]